MRGRVPGTGFPHMLGVCGEAPRLHERDQHRVGAPQPPGDGALQDEFREFFPGARQAEGCRHLLVEESLFRSSPSLRSMRNAAEPRRKAPVTAVIRSQPDWSSHSVTLGKCPHLFEPQFLHLTPPASQACCEDEMREGLVRRNLGLRDRGGSLAVAVRRRHSRTASCT